jgi:hypothetical protein
MAIPGHVPSFVLKHSLHHQSPCPSMTPSPVIVKFRTFRHRQHMSPSPGYAGYSTDDVSANQLIRRHRPARPV